LPGPALLFWPVTPATRDVDPLNLKAGRDHTIGPPRAGACADERHLSPPPAVTIPPVVAPAGAIAPAHDVGAADLIPHDPTNDGADGSEHDGADTGTDADTFDRAGLGGDGGHKHQGRKGCDLRKTAHGYLMVDWNDDGRAVR